MITDAQKTGRLVFAHRKPLGLWGIYDWYECVDCHTAYPRVSGGSTTCNGKIISLCPWCRPDSEPWKNGRGL